MKKRVLVTVLCLVLTMGFAACGGDAGTNGPGGGGGNRPRGDKIVIYVGGSSEFSWIEGSEEAEVIDHIEQRYYDETGISLDFGTQRNVHKCRLVARLSGVLDGREPAADTYVYYPIEDVQAKFTPSVRNDYYRDRWLLMLDDSLRRLARLVNLPWADAEDLENGLPARRIVLPDCTYLSARSAAALEKAAAAGAAILRVGREPKIIGTDRVFSAAAVSPEALERETTPAPFSAPGALVRPFTGGVYMIVNNTEKAIDVTAGAALELLSAEDGAQTLARRDETFTVRPFRAVFAVARPSVPAGER